MTLAWILPFGADSLIGKVRHKGTQLESQAKEGSSLPAAGSGKVFWR